MSINLARPTNLGIILTAIFLLAAAYLEFFCQEKPLAPKVIVVSSCKSLKPGMKRIGRLRGFQFDIPVQDFRVDEWAEDAPPGDETFGLKPKNDVSDMFIDFGPAMVQSSTKTRTGIHVPQALVDSITAADPVSSGHLEKREILDDRGTPIGEDSWGYRNGGERWRRVQFREGPVVARYGSVNSVSNNDSVHEKEAALFDQVMSSVCLLSPQGS